MSHDIPVTLSGQRAASALSRELSNYERKRGMQMAQRGVAGSCCYRDAVSDSLLAPDLTRQRANGDSLRNRGHETNTRRVLVDLLFASRLQSKCCAEQHVAATPDNKPGAWSACISRQASSPQWTTDDHNSDCSESPPTR